MDKPGERPCIDLVSLASFERQLGFERVADAYLEMASRCDGCNCRSPFRCANSGGASGQQEGAGRVVRLRHVSVARPTVESADPLAGRDNLVPMTLERDRLNDPYGNWVERVIRPLTALRSQSAPGSLGLLFEYWRSIWEIGRASLSDVDPIRFGQLGWLGRLHLVDAGYADPREFRFQIRGERIPVVRGASREGVPIGRHPLSILSEIVSRDYERVRSQQEPLLSHVRGELAGRYYRYQRLILPLSSDGTRTDRLLVAIEMQQSTEAAA